jgi:hypothetical protein
MNWPNNCDCATCVALWHELSRRRLAPTSMDGKAFTATLDRFGHTQSGGGQLMHATHTSGHTLSSFSLKRQLG